MDIQKEREAFSTWGATHTDNPNITAYEEGIMFDAWQAAKAQAVLEGLVLVSKDTLNKALNPNDYDEAVCSANELLAVIEAQEKNQ